MRDRMCFWAVRLLSAIYTFAYWLLVCAFGQDRMIKIVDGTVIAMNPEQREEFERLQAKWSERKAG
jgi:hypothetical protein